MNKIYGKVFWETIMIIILITGLSVSVYSWVYREHRNITLLAILRLKPGDRVALEELWTSARKGFESRLSDSVIDRHKM